MSLGIGLDCCHLMLAFGTWACLVNLKVAFGHLPFIMSMGVGLEGCRLMLAFRIWVCLVNLKPAFGYFLSEGAWGELTGEHGHLVLVSGVWACRVNWKLAFGHLASLHIENKDVLVKFVHLSVTYQKMRCVVLPVCRVLF